MTTGEKIDKIMEFCKDEKGNIGNWTTSIEFLYKKAFLTIESSDRLHTLAGSSFNEMISGKSLENNNSLILLTNLIYNIIFKK